MSEFKKYGEVATCLVSETDKAYFGATSVLSHSVLKQMARSPAACKAYKNKPPDPTPAMLRSSALHCHLLTPKLFPFRFIEKTWDARTKEGKAKRDEVEKSDLIALDSDSYAEVLQASTNVTCHKIAEKLVKDAVYREASVYWNRPVPSSSGDMIPCKGKIDGLTKVGDRLVLWDLKWLSKARPDQVERAVIDQSIHTQLAWYAEGLAFNGRKPDDCCLVVVEADAPFEVYVYRLKPDAIQHGHQTNNIRVEAYAGCLSAGSWPGGIEEIIDIGLPKWAGAGEGI